MNIRGCSAFVLSHKLGMSAALLVPGSGVGNWTRLFARRGLTHGRQTPVWRAAAVPVDEVTA
ncbi:MAG: hypothetical protein ABI767_10585 [Rhodanobacter sp.]